MRPSWKLAAPTGAILESGGLPLACGLRCLGFAVVQKPRAGYLGSHRTFLSPEPRTRFQPRLAAVFACEPVWLIAAHTAPCHASLRAPKGPEASSFESPALPLFPYLRVPGEIQGARLNLHFTETTNCFLVFLFLKILFI